MAKTKTVKKKTPLTLGFEAALETLETIVSQLEDGQLPLAESLERYEQGVAHLKTCYQILEKAERRIELLRGVDADGKPIVEPLADDGETTLDFLDDESRPAAAWSDLAGRYGSARTLGLWLATLARAAGASGELAPLRAAMAARPTPLTPNAALERADAAESVGDLIDALAAGADVAACLRGFAIQLDQAERSNAALEFIDVAMALKPERADYAFTRGLIHMSLGNADAARADAARVPDEGQRDFLQLYVRLLFPVFDFWPARETPQTHYDGLPDAPSQPLDAMVALTQKYATRVQTIRTAML